MYHHIQHSEILRSSQRKKFYILYGSRSVFVGPCHHGMARPQFADGGTASDMEGSCE